MTFKVKLLLSHTHSSYTAPGSGRTRVRGGETLWIWTLYYISHFGKWQGNKRRLKSWLVYAKGWDLMDLDPLFPIPLLLWGIKASARHLQSPQTGQYRTATLRAEPGEPRCKNQPKPIQSVLTALDPFCPVTYFTITAQGSKPATWWENLWDKSWFIQLNAGSPCVTLALVLLEISFPLIWLL